MVFVLNKNKKPLNPCHPAKARKLLQEGKAVIHKKFPFTIRLKERKVSSETNGYRLKIDPGSKTTGLSILKDNEVVFLGELHHKQGIKDKLESRRKCRQNRRNRKTRYRQVRFDNRKREKGWLAPSLMARINQTMSWVNRFQKLVPLKSVSVEHVKFDTQKMENPEISGVEYQQGELVGYEVREYLLEKFKRKCAYCEVEGTPLEIEHVIAKSRGGTNRISNLTIACHSCNEDKDNFLLEEWEAKLKKRNKKIDQIRLKNIPLIKGKLKQSLKDAAYMNATRWKLLDSLKSTSLEVETGTGALTKMQRIKHVLPKEHYYDASCVGESTPETLYFKTDHALQIQAKGRGCRYRSVTDKFGFPIRKMPRTKLICGFISGDMVKAIVPNGKYKGTHFGFISMRSSGKCDIKGLKGGKLAQGIDSKHCKILQRFDGYSYSNTQRSK